MTELATPTLAAPEYPKIENLYASNGEQGSGYRRGPEFGFKLPAVEQISKWLVLEKVDGMNIRVIFQAGNGAAPTLRFAGRTDRANLPGDLVEFLQEKFTIDRMIKTFGHTHDEGDMNAFGEPVKVWHVPESVVLFGEGFGPGIQKAGQAYADITGGEKRFILFDALVDGRWWLSFDNVVDVAQKLFVPHVPVLMRDADLDTVDWLVRNRRSRLQLDGGEHVEGVIARTDPYLFDARGNRVMFKHKVRDLIRDLS